MQGDIVTLPDIELESLVIPANLICNETLSPDVEPEEEQTYKVDSQCHTCGARLRVCVVASYTAIRRLQLLLLEDLHLLCPHCARALCENGRAT
ncbi:E7 [Human papillomavirus 148]|uniref:Protein E7 n=1 Tax=Human papillomavirus 148 TaxID=942038 RepID=E7BQC3_9PAPI|nr:E7 [Human papillomavirus 148]